MVETYTALPRVVLLYRLVYLLSSESVTLAPKIWVIITYLANEKYYQPSLSTLATKRPSLTHPRYFAHTRTPMTFPTYMANVLTSTTIPPKRKKKTSEKEKKSSPLKNIQ